MFMFESIEKHLGLHQELRIIYAVDRYEATMYADDDCTQIIAQDTGISIYDALDNLDRALFVIERQA